MASVEALCTLQDEIINNVTSSEKNYKKTGKERIKQPYVKTKLDILEKEYHDFKKIHYEIVSKASKESDEPYFKEKKYEYFEELFIRYKTILLEALQQLQTPRTSSGTSAPAPAPAAASSGSGSNTCDVKLPRINLPTFSGKYEEWQTFYDMFSSLIHDNRQITSVQKLHYLKGNLTGEALNLLRNFSTTEANYDEAWKQLVKRYNNKRYNCNAIMRNLFALKKIHTESADAIRQLLDTTSTCLKSLHNMRINTSTWDTIIVFLVVSKLDQESTKQWEQYLNIKVCEDLPTWEQLQEYLESRFRSLEMLNHPPRSTPPAKPVPKTKTFHTAMQNKTKANGVDCAMCHENHYIYHCKQFELMTPKNRQEFVQTNGLCFNCLSPTHSAIKCRQSLNCRKCGRRHHTMLHFERENNQNEQGTPRASGAGGTASPGDQRHERPSTSPGDTPITAAFSREELQPNTVLLATARVKVFNLVGSKQTIRALLDQGSQASFVTDATVQLLGLTRKPVSGWVSGLGDGRMKIKYTISLRVESRHDPANFIEVNAYVLPSLTSLLPATKLSIPVWTDIENLPLADPTYATPGKIDILLGAEVYSEILLEGIVKQSQGSLMAQNTLFGWILSGRAMRDTKELTNVTSLHVQIKEDELLKKFWEMENEPNTIQKEMSKSEKSCEEYFDATTVRDKDGKFVVRLPFTTDDPKCQYGHSREIAEKRLEALERRLQRDPKLREEYNKVFEEYLRLNHMRPVN